SRALLSIPFAHTVAIEGDLLLVGTGNPAANQAAGVPGVNPYRISRSPGSGAVSLVALAQLGPSSSGYGYKPVARIAASGGSGALLVAGFAGDPSRDGSPGIVSVYRRIG